MLHPSCNIHKHVGPLLGRSRPGSRPIQTRSRPQPQPAPTQTTSSYVLKLVIVWFLSLLQTLGSQSINFGTHVNGTKSANSWIRSVNTIARPLRLSGQATDSCRHLMSYHENMIFYLGPWKPLDHAPLRNPLVPDVRITAGRSRRFLEPYPYIATETRHETIDFGTWIIAGCSFSGWSFHLCKTSTGTCCLDTQCTSCIQQKSGSPLFFWKKHQTGEVMFLFFS